MEETKTYEETHTKTLVENKPVFQNITNQRTDSTEEEFVIKRDPTLHTPHIPCVEITKSDDCANNDMSVQDSNEHSTRHQMHTFDAQTVEKKLHDSFLNKNKNTLYAIGAGLSTVALLGGLLFAKKRRT